MQATTPENNTFGATWFTRMKIAIAGTALVALAVFGAAVMSAPDSPEVDDQAGATWSFTSGDWDNGGGWGGKFDARAFGATWS